MSDIKTLREAAEYHKSEIERLKALGMSSAQFNEQMYILCRREIERMETQSDGSIDHFTLEQVNARDKVVADNAWNAALDKVLDALAAANNPVDIYEFAERVRSLRKGTSND